MRVLVLVAALGLVGTSAAFPQRNKQLQDDAAMMKQLAGAWRLVSWTERLADGTTRQVPLSVGYLIYTDTSRMCDIIMNPNRPKWKSETAPTPEEAKLGIDGLVAYCSTVEVHAKEGFVLHYVEIEKSPNVIGRTRKRWLRFEGANRLILRIDPPENTPPVVDSTLAWERIEKGGK
jgi:hypothetical protein